MRPLLTLGFHVDEDRVSDELKAYRGVVVSSRSRIGKSCAFSVLIDVDTLSDDVFIRPKVW